MLDTKQIEELVHEKLRLEMILGSALTLESTTVKEFERRLGFINDILELNKISKERMD